MHGSRKFSQVGCSHKPGWVQLQTKGVPNIYLLKSPYPGKLRRGPGLWVRSWPNSYFTLKNIKLLLQIPTYDQEFIQTRNCIMPRCLTAREKCIYYRIHTRISGHQYCICILRDNYIVKYRSMALCHTASSNNR